MMLKNSLLSAVAFTIGVSALGQGSLAPKYSNEFLSVGVGARALGMSNAFIASADDVTAGYWNPTGLLNVKNDLQVGLMHAEYFAGIAKYDYGAIAKPINDKSAIGFSIIRFGVDDIANTTQLIDNQGNWDYDRIERFSAADYGFLFSYAQKTGISGLSVGGNVKIIHRKIGDFASSWGFGIDAAASYVKNEWQFAAMFRDVTSTFNAWSFNLSDDIIEVFEATNNEIPTSSIELTLPKLILAAMRKWELGTRFTLQPELNLDITFDGKRNVLLKSNFASIDPHLGVEFGFKQIVFVRAGMGNIQTVRDIDNNESLSLQPNVGLGIRIKQFTIDYALTNINQSVGLYSNIFSLRFDINKPSS